MTGEAGAVAALVAEFPQWTIALRPAGLHVCTALWESSDHRTSRYIVAGSAAELLAELRAKATAEQRAQPVTAP